jgi:hypothetical protein
LCARLRTLFSFLPLVSATFSPLLVWLLPSILVQIGQMLVCTFLVLAVVVLIRMVPGAA